MIGWRRAWEVNVHSHLTDPLLANFTVHMHRADVAAFSGLKTPPTMTSACLLLGWEPEGTVKMLPTHMHTPSAGVTAHLDPTVRSIPTALLL